MKTLFGAPPPPRRWLVAIAIVAALAVGIAINASVAAGQKGDVPPGRIAGSLNHPSGQVPSLTVVAYRHDGSMYWVVTEPGQERYELTDLPPGRYRVAAYPQRGGITGGYLDEDGDLREFTVASGQSRGGIDPTDWSAAELLPAAPEFALAAPAPPRAGGAGLFDTDDGGSMLFLAVAGGLLAVGLAGAVYAGHSALDRRRG